MDEMVVWLTAADQQGPMDVQHFRVCSWGLKEVILSQMATSGVMQYDSCTKYTIQAIHNVKWQRSQANRKDTA